MYLSGYTVRIRCDFGPPEQSLENCSIVRRHAWPSVLSAQASSQCSGVAWRSPGYRAFQRRTRPSCRSRSVLPTKPAGIRAASSPWPAWQGSRANSCVPSALLASLGAPAAILSELETSGLGSRFGPRRGVTTCRSRSGGSSSFPREQASKQLASLGCVRVCLWSGNTQHFPVTHNAQNASARTPKTAGSLQTVL